MAQLVQALRYKREGCGFDSQRCGWNFSSTYFRPYYGPGVDSASNSNEYQNYFLVGKGGRCVRLTNHLHVPIVIKSGNLNRPEPSGPVQACNGIALPSYLLLCNTAGVSGFFIDIKSFRSHFGPGVDSASNRNEYQEHFLGVKAAGA